MMSLHRPIFLLTDFGSRDPYVGIMKSVLLVKGHRGPVVDLCHGIPPQDVLAGALAIGDTLPWLPESAVLCAVVDPGVGSSRRAIAIDCGGIMAVGPDNGLLSSLFADGSIVRRIDIQTGPLCPTFHGRDLFAPAAAWLAMGNNFSNIGAILEAPQRLDVLNRISSPEGNQLTLRVVAIDHFGNVSFNLWEKHIPVGWNNHQLHLKFDNFIVEGIRSTFADVPQGKPVMYINSGGRLELAIRDGNAAMTFNINPGDHALLEYAHATH